VSCWRRVLRLVTHRVGCVALAGALCFARGGECPRTGSYVARILKGEKPSELSVQQGTKLELFINATAARSLGIAVPLPLSGRADEVIE
jgi:ABC-type uncharacterized transport system substrate-binding protein